MNRSMQRDLFLPKPQERLAHTPDLGEFREDELDGVLDPLIGMLFDPPVARLDIAYGEAEDQSPSPRLREQALLRALPNPPQLRLADRALQAEQEPIVQLARIVDALRIHDQRVHQSAQVEELVPIAIVAREPRDLEPEHCARVAQAPSATRR
jgi:hypothetical protein